MSDFPSSIWTRIIEFKKDPEQVKDQIVRRYRQPVYEFLRRQGLTHEDAEDLAQEVFARIAKDEFLEKADRRKGKFRSLLLAVTRHVIASFRRYELAAQRDRRKEVGIEDLEIPQAVPPDGEFDRLWVKNLIQGAMERLKHDPALAALRLQLEGKSYQEIASELGKRETDVTNHIYRAKQRIKLEVESMIKEYCGEGEVQDEIASLLKYL
jgi:RNA polymerase sigma-70 factor (ECF subfamily)